MTAGGDPTGRRSAKRPKHRALDAEERALWKAVADTVSRRKTAAKPIAPESGPAPGPAGTARPAQIPPAPASPTRPASAPAAPPASPRLTPNGSGGAPATQVRRADRGVETPSARTPGIDRRTAERMARGKRAPDARIDLHGMTAERAHRALAAFIRREHAAGSRMVLVITGKGGRRPTEDAWAAEGRGVLRAMAPVWLSDPPLGPLVVGVFEAHQSHGGGGALYVYLRKARM